MTDPNLTTAQPEKEVMTVVLHTTQTVPPVPQALKAKLGFTLKVERSFSADDYRVGHLTQDEMHFNPDDIHGQGADAEDNDWQHEFTPDDWEALNNLSDNLGECLDDIAGATSAMYELAEQGHVSVDELLDTLFATSNDEGWEGLTLIHLQGTQPLYLYPQGDFTEMWAIGSTLEDAENRAWWHVLENFGHANSGLITDERGGECKVYSLPESAKKKRRK